jgi:hypothetical protein
MQHKNQYNPGYFRINYRFAASHVVFTLKQLFAGVALRLSGGTVRQGQRKRNLLFPDLQCSAIIQTE